MRQLESSASLHPSPLVHLKPQPPRVCDVYHKSLDAPIFCLFLSAVAICPYTFHSVSCLIFWLPFTARGSQFLLDKHHALGHGFWAVDTNLGKSRRSAAKPPLVVVACV